MPMTARHRNGRRAPGLAWALIAAGLATALPGPGAVSAGESVSVDIGLQAPSLVAPGQLIGDWLTIVRTNGKPQPVRLTIHRVEPGKTAGKLTYSSPRRCTVDLEYGGPDRDRHIFYIIPFTNCFKYKKTDYVAIWMAEPAFQSADRSRQRAAGGGADADGAEPSGTSLVPRIQGVERVRYAVVKNDQPTESGLLTKQ